MKKTIYILPLLIAATAPAATATLAGEMSQYVYPQNRPASPGNMTYWADGETYCAVSDNNRLVVRHKTTDGTPVDTLFDIGHTRETVITDFEGFMISPDGSKMMLWRDSRPIYRRSFTAEYYTYDIRSRVLRPLSTKFGHQQSPIFSHNGRMVAFVAENNIYVKKLDYNTELPVTTDGKANSIINGVPDWVYEEEFTTTCAMAWSPDDLILSYVKSNETDVPTYDMTRHGGTCEPDDALALYPSTWNYKYPLAGFPNSRVSLHSYDVETRKTKDIPMPDNRLEYIPRIAYGPDAESLIVVTLNRDQNLCIIYKVNPKSTVAREVYNETSETWINPATYEDLYVGPRNFVVTSWKDGYTRFYVYNYNGVETAAPATGDCDVMAYYGNDAAGNHYYCVAAPTPMDRKVCRIDVKGRITDLSPDTGNASAVFSPAMNFMTLRYDNPEQPPVYTLCTAAGKQLRVIEDNATFASQAKGLVAPREFFTMNSDGNTLNGFIIKPRDFNPSKRYPVVMYQYSGPQSQEVLHRWQLDWMDAFAAKGYVVVCVDGRGTGGRGRKFCDIVYKRLGYYETIDQLAAARHAASLPYADASRIAIFGWSYGGYEALMCATALDNPYKAAVAVAPVTDWRFYDSVYAERYMLTPAQNEDGYRQSAPLTTAHRLQCPLLMMYGTADDNVHPANTLEFVSRLQSAGILCDMLVFPNMNHSINGCNARSVVYANMLRWLDKNL